MKYLTVERCRLVDRGVCLAESDVYDPQDVTYEKTSKSLAAAIRAGWVKVITDKEADRLEVERVDKLTKGVKEEIPNARVDQNQPKAISRKINKDVEVATPDKGLGEVTDEDMADEVLHQEPIIAARDNRRNSTQRKVDIKKTADSIKSEIKEKMKKSLRIGKRKK